MSKGKENERGIIAHFEGEGLLLSVVNPLTCQTTLNIVTLTSDMSGFRELLWGLESILPGRLVMVASVVCSVLIYVILC